MRGTVVSVVAGLTLVLLRGAAQAQAAPDAGDEDALIRDALQNRRRGNDHMAQVELQRAYDIAHSPRAAAQLGFAEQALGLWPQAEAHIGEALRATDDRWIRRNRATLEESLRTIRAHVGRIEIVGGTAGAQVTVNGLPVGLLPLAAAVAVAAGPVEVVVRTPGGPVAQKTVNVAVGEYARVAFTAAAVTPVGVGASPPAPTAPVALAPPMAGGARDPGPAVQVETKDVDRGRGRRYAGIGLATGGLVAVGAGVAASLVAKHKFDAINADAAADRPYDESNGNWKGYQTAATVLYAVGAGALIGGTVLWISGRGDRETAGGPAAAPPVAAVSLKPQLAPGRAGAALSVRF